MKLHYQNNIELTRLACGVLEITADNECDLYFGQGYAQAMDRGMQMILTRILGQGRAAECLLDNDDMLQIDIFFRRMNWYSNMEDEIAKIPGPVLEKLRAWCAGIDAGFRQSIPWEMRFLKIPVEPWEIEDCLLLMRMIGYMSLQQSQAEMERLIVQFVQARVPKDYLEELFPGLLQGLDEELLREVRLKDKIVPDSITWNPWASAFIFSNNWAVSGRKSATGNSLLANDPHLEANRLPNVWQEYVLKCKGRYAAGAGMPGLPGILVGRNNDVAWGATYTFMDSVDSWVEECRDGQYLKDGEWRAFVRRKEIIRRKKHGPCEMVFYDNDHGTLDGDPYQSGRYLTTLWSGGRGTGAKSLEAMFKVLMAGSVTEMMEIMGEVEVSFNWVAADRSGNIGYQMSGLLPKRREGVSGLIPMDGATSENDWQGFYGAKDIPRCYNPDCGYIVTANDDLNHLGKVRSINLPLGPYRARRIAEVLAKSEKVTVDDCIRLQYDTFSHQARAFLEILTPLMDDSPGARILKGWDCRYELASKGPWLFERFYIALIEEVFGQISSTQGQVTPIEHLLHECSTFITFYANFDQVLLSPNSRWFRGRSREQVFKEVFMRVVSPLHEKDISVWGKRQQIMLNHILFAGKMPRFLGFDRGPIAVPGGRATPHQGQIYRNAGRTTSFVPSLRVIADLAEETILTQILGGPSDRRFSRWYASEVEAWKNRIYKKLGP